MSKPIFYGRLDFIELLTAVSYLSSDRDRSDWLLSFSRSLAKNEHGMNDLADSILDEAKFSRDAETKRKEAYRAKFVPRTDTDGICHPCDRQTVSVSVPVSVPINTDNTDNTKNTGQKFCPPSLETCISLFESKGCDKIEATRFWGYYESNGWKVGKNRMKSLNGAITGWTAKTVSNGLQTAFVRESTQERINRENEERIRKMQKEEQLLFLGDIT